MNPVARGQPGALAHHAMCSLQLQPHVSFAIVDGQAIFLDLERDRYLTLSPTAASLFERMCNRLDSATAEEAAELLGTGLFVAARRKSQLVPAKIPAVEAGLQRGNRSRIRVRDAIEVAQLVGRARRALRSKPLYQIVDRRSARGSESDEPKCREEIVQLAERFADARTWVPIKPSCFQDLLALSDWLGRRGAFARLVFGVKLNPFAAHCWIQLGGIVLNDAPDNVTAFTPILGVG